MRRLRCVSILFPALALTVQAEHTLRSPWDGHRVKVTEAAYSCPAVVHLSRDLTTNGFYSDSKSSVIDPEKWKTYSETAGPYKQLGQDIVDAADAYRATGSRAAAECVLQHMDAAAKDGVFTGKMSSNQSYYVQGWVIGAIAIGYLKVRDSGLVTGDEKKAILPWMVKVVHQTMDYYDSHRQKGQAQNNHLYWAGVEAAAAGIAANDRGLFDWGIGTYHEGVKEIQPDGTLPQEMRRGQRALHYHLYALAPLIYLAEFGEDNGLHLYAENDSAIRRLVKICEEGMVDNSLFVKQAGIAQDTPKGAPMAEEMNWGKVYVMRFPDPAIAKLVSEAPSLSYMYLGGLPPGA